MAGFAKQVIRIGVIGAVATGGVIAVASIADQPRFKAAWSQTKHNINERIDNSISDPAALEVVLKELAADYPDRIADVKGDLAELRNQRATLEREAAVSARVIELADADINKLDAGLVEAESTAIKVASLSATPRRVVLVHGVERLDLDQARAKRNHIAATRNAYQNRLADMQRDDGYLERQERQLVNLLTKLETEHTNFKTQLFDLKRQIKSIDRNDRMIAMMEKRQETLEEQSRYSAAGFDGVQARIAEVKARQEHKLAMLSGDQDRESYEARASLMLDRETIEQGATYELAPITTPVLESIEVNIDDLDTSDKSDAPLASNAH